MSNILTKIFEHKKMEVAELSKSPLLHQILKEGSSEPCLNRLKNALKRDRLAVIAEIKKHSPSVGEIHSCLDPVEQAGKYFQGGASAISILTDQRFFKGSIEDLKQVRSKLPSFPLLKKDFVIDPLQIAEAVLAKASAVLLIVSILGKSTKKMLQEVRRLNLEALVEVHDREELEIALDAGAEIIGVNCRNLNTFEVNLEVAEKLSPYLQQHVVKVAESGIKSAQDAFRMRQSGYDAVLVGETLMRSENPEQFIKSMQV